MTDTLWSHPWAFALIAAAIGFWGELTFYTSEEGAAAMYALAAGTIAYLGALLLRSYDRHHQRAHQQA